MNVLVPQNSFNDLRSFFSTEKKPVLRVEMMIFWRSLTIKEKHYYMCQSLS